MNLNVILLLPPSDSNAEYLDVSETNVRIQYLNPKKRKKKHHHHHHQKKKKLSKRFNLQLLSSFLPIFSVSAWVSKRLKVPFRINVEISLIALKTHKHKLYVTDLLNPCEQKLHPDVPGQSSAFNLDSQAACSVTAAMIKTHVYEFLCNKYSDISIITVMSHIAEGTCNQEERLLLTC